MACHRRPLQRFTGIRANGGHARRDILHQLAAFIGCSQLGVRPGGNILDGHGNMLGSLTGFICAHREDLRGAGHLLGSGCRTLNQAGQSFAHPGEAVHQHADFIQRTVCYLYSEIPLSGSLQGSFDPADPAGQAPDEEENRHHGYKQHNHQDNPDHPHGFIGVLEHRGFGGSGEQNAHRFPIGVFKRQVRGLILLLENRGGALEGFAFLQYHLRYRGIHRCAYSPFAFLHNGGRHPGIALEQGNHISGCRFDFIKKFIVLIHFLGALVQAVRFHGPISGVPGIQIFQRESIGAYSILRYLIADTAFEHHQEHLGHGGRHHKQQQQKHQENLVPQLHFTE
ncbi:hypothetical protein D3C75_802380 [compost metagenome]